MDRNEKNALFEVWYQRYTSAHEGKHNKESMRWAFWAGLEVAQQSVQRDGSVCTCLIMSGELGDNHREDCPCYSPRR